MQQYTEVMESFGITSKISAIITDNASNMNASDSDGDSDTDDDDDDVEHVDVEVPELPQQSSCFAHTVQLLVKDGFKVATQTNKVLAKASTTVNHVRKSTVATELLEGENKLQAANATRWNSQLKMVHSILYTPVDKLDAFDTAKLTTYDRNILQNLVNILTPIEVRPIFCNERKQYQPVWQSHALWETGGKEKGVGETGGKEKGVGETGGKTTGVKEREVGETRAKEWEVGETGAKETGGKGSGQNVMEGIERKSYSAAVIEGVKKRARVFVGDSIVRKNDRVLNKGDDVVVCLPGAKIEAITERVKNIVGSGKGGSVLVHVGTNNVEREGTTAIVRKYRQLVRTLKQTRVEQVILSGILPVMGRRGHKYRNCRGMAINMLVQKLCREEEVGFVDLWGSFVGRADMYMKDGLHLSGKGAAVFADKLSAAVDSDLGTMTNIFGSKHSLN